MTIAQFNFEGQTVPVVFLETFRIANGVECDVYTFVGDTTRDPGIIRIAAGCRTPRQQVLQGDRTVEGYISGKGKLTISKPDGSKVVHPADPSSSIPPQITVAIGEIMQWEAAPTSDLIAYEICFPPYQDGRYKNLT